MAFLSTAGIEWLYSAVTNTKASSGAMAADQRRMWSCS